MRLVQQTKFSLDKAWVHIEPWSPEPCRAAEAQSRVGRAVGTQCLVGRAVGKAKEEEGETRQQWATEACNNVLPTMCYTVQQNATLGSNVQ